jgi:hypothetical protein
MSEILQHAGQVFLIKGNDIVPIAMNKPLFSGNTESPNVKTAQSLIADGYELAMSDNEKANELVRNNFTKGNTPMTIPTDAGLGSRVVNAVRNLGGKIPGALGILDILGMKKEYDEIRKGEGLINKLLPTTEEYSKRVFKDGGFVNIFDID